MSNNNTQPGEPISVYKSTQAYSYQQSQSRDDDEDIDSAPSQKYYQPQPTPQNARPYPTSYPNPPAQYSNQSPQQYSSQYAAQYQANQQPQYQGAYPPQYQGNYPPQQYQGNYPQQQYPPQQYQQYQQYQQHPQYPGAPGQYPGQHPGRFPPPQYGQPVNIPYGQIKERGVFSNLFDGVFASMLGTVIIAPFIQARKMLSIRPELHPGEKLQRYMYGLPQLLRQQGITTLWKDLSSSVVKIPAQTLDLVFFFGLKKIVHPSSRVMPWEVSWLSNVFIAGTASSLRYLVYQPVLDAYGRISSYQSGFKGYANEIKNSLKNRYQNKGFKGLYSKPGVNIPILMLYRGLQLGSIETAFQEIKHQEGHTSLFRKFLVCFSYTVLARFLLYPLEVSKEGVDEGSVAKNLKKMFQKAGGVVKGANLELFRVATSRSFQASTSAMSFAIFYHLRDDAPRY